MRKEAGKIFKKQGMDLKLTTKVTQAKASGKGVTITMEPAGGGEGQVLDASHVLVSIGRRPNTEGLGLEAVGLQTNNRGQIETDHDFRTKVSSIWAIGDCIPGPMLAHKAEDEGIAVAENIAGQTGIVNHAIIPNVVYTMPEFAGVGLTEEEAKEQGSVKIGKFPMMANSRAKTNREPDGFVKVIADADTDRVLGVWMVNNLAGTMVAQAAQAMEFGATSEDIAYTCHAPSHPFRGAERSGHGGAGQAYPHIDGLPFPTRNAATKEDRNGSSAHYAPVCSLACMAGMGDWSATADVDGNGPCHGG